MASIQNKKLSLQKNKDMKFSKILLLLVVVAVSIVSCKKDDGPDLTIDSDGDGVADVNDLCPNSVGTVLDSGCYLLTNINIAGTHDLTYYSEIKTSIIPLGSGTVTVTENVTADTYQLEVVFTEAGGYTVSGEYRITTTSSDPNTPPVTEIIVVSSTGTYQVNAAAETIILTESGSSSNDNSINTVTLFNQTDLRFTSEEIYVDPLNNANVTEMQELRFVRR